MLRRNNTTMLPAGEDRRANMSSGRFESLGKGVGSGYDNRNQNTYYDNPVDNEPLKLVNSHWSRDDYASAIIHSSDPGTHPEGKLRFAPVVQLNAEFRDKYQAHGIVRHLSDVEP